MAAESMAGTPELEGRIVSKQAAADGVDHKPTSLATALPQEGLETARSLSPLLQAMDQDVDVPFPAFLVKRWLAVAAGGDFTAEEAVDLLQVASFLQDEGTYERLVSTVVAAMAKGFEASRHSSPSPRRCEGAVPCEVAIVAPDHLFPLLTIPADDVEAECIEIVHAMHPRAECMLPHDRARALGGLPLTVVSRLPPPLQIEALSARVTATATSAPTAGTGSLTGPHAPKATGAPGPATRSGTGHAAAPVPSLVVQDAAPCEIARVFFHAALLPVQPIYSISVGGPGVEAGEDGGGPPRPSSDCCTGVYCRCAGLAIAMALRAHAATLRHLTLRRVVLLKTGVAALTAALADPCIRLESLVLASNPCDWKFESCDLRAALCTQSALTQLDLDARGWLAVRESGVTLSSLPRLRKLRAALGQTCSRAERWLVGELGQGCLRGLEGLELSRDFQFSHELQPGTLMQDLFASLHQCPQLRVLDVGGYQIPPELRDARFALPELACVRIRLTEREAVLPMAWLSGLTQLREIYVTTAGAAWMAAEVCAAELARAVPGLCALTRLEVLGTLAGNRGGCVGLLRALAPLPHLEVLRLVGLGVEGTTDSAQMATEDAAAGAHTVTEAQRRWLRIFGAPKPQHSTALEQTQAPPTEKFPMLRMLDLSSNGLSAAHLTIIEEMPHLTRLELPGNCLGDGLCTARSTARSAEHYASQAFLLLLARLTRLQIVNLAWNGIDDDGALRVLCALRRLPLLEVVDLGLNEVSSLPARCLLRDVVLPAEAQGVLSTGSPELSWTACRSTQRAHACTLDLQADDAQDVGAASCCAVRGAGRGSDAVVFGPVATWDDVGSFDMIARADMT